MNLDTHKTIIRIIQDYCFDNSAIVLCDKFALAITPAIAKSVANKSLSISIFKQICMRRRDFFIANNITNYNAFCKDLFRRLIYELSFCSDTSLLESIITFKRKMENGNFRGFPKLKITEDTLRCTLVIFLQQETFCEPRSAAGNSDITIPSERVVIETKLWNGIEYYNSGFPELHQYLDKNDYNEGYYIVFDYNKSENEIVKEHGEVFSTDYYSKHIHVLFIRMNAVCPSQIYRHIKKGETNYE